MASAGNGKRPFQFEFSSALAEAIRLLQRQASREGRGAEFLSALRQMENSVSSLRMQVRCAAIPPLYMDFAVCEDRPMVFIKAVKLLAKQGS